MIAIDTIQREVAAAFGMPMIEMRTIRRRWSLARMVAMYLSRELTTASLPKIGSVFGGKDHSTVFSAVRRVPILMAADVLLAERVGILRGKLEGKVMDDDDKPIRH